MTHSVSVSRRRRLPRFPFFKDEKVVPGLTTARVIRLFIITVVLALLVLGYAVNKVVDLQDGLRDTITNGRAARLADQRRTDALIRANQIRDDKAIQDLVCFAVSDVPPGRSVKADEFRAKYKCPPYKATKAGSVGSASAAPGAPSTAVTVSSSPAAVPSASVTASSSPSGSMSPIPTASTSSSPIINLSSILCSPRTPLCR